MSEAGKRLIASANGALDLVKRLRDKNCCNSPDCKCDEAADTIERLERELAAETARNEKNKTVAANATVLASDRGFEIEELQAQLSAEKALSERLYYQHAIWGRDNGSAEEFRRSRGLW